MTHMLCVGVGKYQKYIQKFLSGVKLAVKTKKYSAVDDVQVMLLGTSGSLCRAVGMTLVNLQGGARSRVELALKNMQYSGMHDAQVGVTIRGGVVWCSMITAALS